METVVTAEREGLGLRSLKFFTPKRLHKFYTKEAFIAWNASSWFTLAQVTIFQKCWPWIATKLTSCLVASKVLAKDLKDAFIEAVLI